MELYGNKDNSIPQKIILLALEVIFIGISYWILFAGGYNDLFQKDAPATGNAARHTILFIFHLIVFARMCITFFYLVKRHIPWQEAFSIPFAFALYYLGFSLFGFKSTTSIGLFDIIAIALFLTGSFINTVSEMLRKNWKKDRANGGKIYTSGLFKYSMHINYFGDLLWVSAYAMITRNIYSILIPLFLFVFFAFYNIPMLDKYLSLKYGKDFDEYRKTTKRFIPFIY